MSDANTPVKFKAGDTIFTENQMSDGLYIIRKGQIEVFRKNKEGEKLPLAIVNSGSYLGELAVFAGRPHSSTAVALTEVEAIRLSKESIEAQLEQAPSWLVALTRGLVERLSTMNDVLKRNGLVDEKLSSAIQAAEQHREKA